MKRVVFALFMLTITLPASAESQVDAGLREVRELGVLNGQALACSQMQSMSRIKSLMIKHAPKSRRYGEAFEVATNESYLVQAKKEPADCPDEAVIAARADGVGERLRTAIPATQAQ